MKNLLIISLCTIFLSCTEEYAYNYTFYVGGHIGTDYELYDDNGVHIGDVMARERDVELRSATETVIVQRMDSDTRPKRCRVRSYGYYYIEAGELGLR